MWSREELDRYARHIVLPGVGGAGQARLKQSSVLVVGAGGLGSPVLLYLAAAGVGRLGIVEMDTVDLSNLQRQVLFATEAVGKPKAEAARERLLALNPNIAVEVYATRLSAENALETLRPYELVVDASDNFPTRYLLSDACVLLGKPLVYGAIHQFEGQVSVFNYAGGPCYRCFFPEPPQEAPNCAEAGVFGVLPGVVGSLMATEVLKLLLEIGEPLSGKLLVYDGLYSEFRTLGLRRREGCAGCGVNGVSTLSDLDLYCDR
jgi:molybdopterin/thiamine biosynthesis adenylyltransferase